MKRNAAFCATLLVGMLSLSVAAAPTTKSKAHPTKAADGASTTKKKPTAAVKSTKSSKAAATPKPAPATTPPAASESAPTPEHAPAATLEPSELREFAAQPPGVQALITAALALTKRNLTYTFGSADPEKGGMDCSGTMYHLLRAHGYQDVPRDSSGQYQWVRTGRPFYNVLGKTDDSFELDDLLPGDLLFWTGTYGVKREIPISHVMLYLGTEKKTKKPVMFGASNGRSYAGISRWGVSVFDFKMPRADKTGNSGATVDFVGYARIPGLRDAPNPGATTSAATVGLEEAKAAGSKTGAKPKASKPTSRTKIAE